LTKVWAVILGVAVSKMPRAPSLRSLFLAWVCFSLAFNTVFQAYLTTYLVDSGYKTHIQNMDELFASGIKLAYPPQYNIIFENGDETEISKVQRNSVNCPSFDVCMDWAKNHKNASILLPEAFVADLYSVGEFLGPNSEPLLCKLEDGVVYSSTIQMLMFPGDPLAKRFAEMLQHIFEAGLSKQYYSNKMYSIKLRLHKTAIFQQLDGYYSFNLYHMQPAFFLLLMGWCLSAFCFMFEVLYNRLLSKRN
jgi:hypothetical protein